jgi:hypothetical protein
MYSSEIRLRASMICSGEAVGVSVIVSPPAMRRMISFSSSRVG